jgi:hypothetical protein
MAASAPHQIQSNVLTWPGALTKRLVNVFLTVLLTLNLIIAANSMHGPKDGTSSLTTPPSTEINR